MSEPKRLSILLLLIAAAAFHILGATTVAINYRIGAEVGRHLKSDGIDSYRTMQEIPRSIANYLSPKLWMAVGIGSFFVGTTLGLVASIVWLYSGS
jgi:hypothetical protein